MLKKVRIHIATDRCELQGALWETPTGKALPNFDADPSQRSEIQHLEMTTEAVYHDDGSRVCISYKESELSGMEGSKTSISFQKNDPSFISMLRDGSVRTAMIFQPSKRHHSVYQTDIMPFDVCIFTRTVDNRIESDGILQMDYAIELRGAQAEHTKFQMKLLPDFDRPMRK